MTRFIGRRKKCGSIIEGLAIISHKLPEIVLKFSACDTLWSPLILIACCSCTVLQGHTAPNQAVTDVVKWTHEMSVRLAENCLVGTDFTQLVKKVDPQLWLLVNGCKGLHCKALKMMVSRMFWSCQQLGHLLHGRVVQSTFQCSKVLTRFSSL